MLFPRLLLATTRRAFSTRAPERTRILTKMPLWSASCISAVSADTQMSILVECEAWSYMFNCGEGTTRSMHQIRGGYRKLRGIFVTGVDSERSSGLPGLCCLAFSYTINSWTLPLQGFFCNRLRRTPLA